MSFLNRLRLAREGAFNKDQYANRPDAWVGAVVDGSNQILAPNGPAWVYVTLNKGDQRGSAIQVLNRNISPVWNLPVMLGINKMGQPCIVDVAESQVDAFSSGSSGGSSISFKTAPHSHEYGYGNYDMVDTRRLTEGKVWWRSVDGSVVVYINPLFYPNASGVKQYYPGGTLNLSSVLTNAPGQHQWVEVALNPTTGVPVAIAGTPANVVVPLQNSDLAAIVDTGYYPLFGVQITYGQAISGDGDFTDCSYVRVGGATGSASPLTTKGDVYTHSTVDARLGVGIDNSDLIADSTQTTGLRWRTPLIAVAYNYRLAAGVISKVGFGLSSDGRRWSRKVEPAIDIGAGGSWEDEQTHDPCLVVVNGIIWAYYSGYDGANWKIGLARSYDGGLTFTKYGSNPIVSAAAGWESTGSANVGFPTVLYDVTETNSAKRWKLWYYGGASGSGGIGYAYSSDGLSWTKFSGNPVLAPSSGWESTQINPGAIVKLGTTYYLFYDGATVTTASAGLLTFANPEGTYTKSSSNPLLIGDGISTTITSNVSINDTSIAVTSSATFSIGAAVHVYDATNKYTSYIASITDSTHVVLSDAAPVAILSASGNVRSVAYNSVNIRSALYDGGWTFGLVGYQPLFDTSHLHETAILGYADPSLAQVYIDYSAGLILRPTLAETMSENVSMENPSIVPLIDTPRRFLSNPASGSSYYQTVQNQGSNLTQRSKLDAVNGTGVDLIASDDGGSDRSKLTPGLNINGLTADSAPDPTADYVATYDASASTSKKVLLSNLAVVGGAVSVLNVNTTQVGNVGAGEDDLITFSLTGGQLSTNGDRLHGVVSIHYAATLNTKTLKAYLGSTVFFNSGALSITTASDAELEFWIIRTASNAQLIIAEFTSSNAALTATSTITSGSEDLTTTLTLKCTGTATANDDIVQKSLALDKYAISGTASADKIVIVQDQKTSGTSGGTFTSGAWRTRDLNTVVLDSGSIAALSSSQVTLPAGSYTVSGWASAYDVNTHKARLRDVTNGATLALGASSYTRDTSGAGPNNDRSLVEGYFVLSGSAAIELQHWCVTTKSSNGFGDSSGLDTELYSSLTIMKIA